MATLSEDTIKKIARDLYTAEKERRTLRPLTEEFAGIEIADAYRIQLSLIEMKKADGAKVAGKKIGLTSWVIRPMPWHGWRTRWEVSG